MVDDAKYPEPRRIRTARSISEINEAARLGFRPLVRPVEPSPEIRSKFRVTQNQATGEIDIQADYRCGPPAEGWEVVIDWRHHYPHAWTNPFAAYLLPADLRVGEAVILDDLIEDLVGTVWNQGDAYRLKCCAATWNGETFELEKKSRRTEFVVG
jgi:hypothetical protein